MEVDMETSSSFLDPEDLSIREQFRRYGFFIGSIHVGSQSLKACKIENDALADSGETTFALFASLLDSALQELMPIQDLILSLERSCRNVSESIRYGSNIQLRVVEDKLMRQKAQLLLDEFA
ncbi:nuclear pore complex protein NUP107-like, partial [Pistacia vera]|uniref:nuclear pore complex protein NUP107-like n=1 Tax=Pistacia vera TaxID=55513 RepID=UPI00126363B7